jgi:tyrosine decarboxylase/aspartate 1-decarboxylase
MDVDIIKNKLTKMGWSLSIAEYPHAIRLVIMPHVKKEHIDLFINDLNQSLQEY